MKHLEDVNMTYIQHLILAIVNSGKLLLSSIILFFHGLYPCIFEHTASSLLKSIKFPVSGDRILIRFNTKWEADPEKRQWRVLVNGAETLAYNVIILTNCKTIEEEVEGVQKFHFLCHGSLTLEEGNARIE